jgi:hypothetical protein
MVWQGKIDFQKPITINGKPHGIEHLASLPVWSASDEGRVVHDESTGKVWIATSTAWVELTPGGVGAHDHNDLYYTESEVDAFFDGDNAGKKIVSWTNVSGKPTILQQSDVTFSLLNGNGVVGSSSTQVAAGDHTHTGYAPASHTHIADDVTYDNTSTGLASTDVQSAITELDSSLSSVSFDADEIGYDNTTSGLVGSTAQAAIDELDEGLDRVDLVITREYWVDQSHPGSYTPTGSRIKPFKTIADAIAVATPGSSIYVGAGSYTENFTVPNRVSMHGAGLSKTILIGAGTITIGDGQPNATTHFTGFSIRQHVNIDMSGGKVIFRDAYISNEGYVTVTSGDADGLSASTTTANPALTMLATAGSVTSLGNYFASPAGTVISQAGGSLSLANCLVTGSDAGAIISSTGGQFVSNDSFIVNSGGGLAVDCDNGAAPTLPNIIADTLVTGNISTGSAVTIIEGVNGGQVLSSVSGANLLLTPASLTSFDDSLVSLGATNVQDAIEAVDGKTGILSLTGGTVPSDSPATGTFRFDETTNTLYVYNGSAWTSTVLTVLP